MNLDSLIAQFYDKWRAVGWCQRPDCKETSCQDIRNMFAQIAEHVPGRDLPKPIRVTVIPTPELIPPPEPIIHILTRYGNVLGRCLQGAPHTWPAHHWAVPREDWTKANCKTCLKGKLLP